MLISIVTPAYNAETFLASTVESALAQTVTDWEMVIVDDGSSDTTLRIARQFAEADHRIRAVTKPNGGVADARNFGCERIEPASRFVIFLDHDDVWKPHALECLMRALGASPSSVASHGLALQTDLNGTPITPISLEGRGAGGEGCAPAGTIMGNERRKVVGARIAICSRAEPTGFATLLCDCIIPTPGIVLIRRDALEKIRASNAAYFDTSLGSGCDWDLYLRLSLQSDFAFVDEVLLDWRMHGANGSEDKESMFVAEARVRRKMASWPELTDEQRRMAQWRYQRVMASVERRNADLSRQQAMSNLGRGDLRAAARFARLWMSRYGRYVGTRLLKNQTVDKTPYA